MRTVRDVARVALLLTAIGCGKGTEPTPTVNGTWSGTVNTNQVLTMTLVQTGASVTGSGTLSNTPSGTRAQTIQGSFSNPNFTATFSSGSSQPFNMQGTLANLTITASLTGSGFTGDAITLTRSAQ